MWKIVAFSVIALTLFRRKMKFYKPVNGVVTSKFGWRTMNGAQQFHNGTDYGVVLNTPIKAACDGIAWINYDALSGNYVIINHEDNYRTGYAHLARFNVVNGQKVKAGDVIGWVGMTGNTTGPHLHVTLYKGTEPLDPELYFN